MLSYKCILQVLSVGLYHAPDVTCLVTASLSLTLLTVFH